MTTYYEFPAQLAEKWSNSGSPSCNPSDSENQMPKPGPEKTFISLRLSNMPKDITIQQLYKSFSPKGNIQVLEIFGSRPEETKAVGRIAFAPPPKIEFWENQRFDLHLEDHKEPITIRLKLLEVKHEAPRSSHEQRCPPTISMRLKSLDFGSLLNKDTMVIGETIESTEAGDLSLEFETRTGEITLYFQFPEKKRYLSGKRQYKLTTNVSAISKV